MKKLVNFVIAFAMVAIASSAFAQQKPKCNHGIAIGILDNSNGNNASSTNNGAVVRTGATR